MADSPLLDLQAPRGVPLTPQVERVNDPLLPPRATTEALAHFYEGIYDLSPESHLSRLLGVLLGDTGVGQLRKRSTYAHLSQVVTSAHFYDLDRLFSDIFGLHRFLTEGLPFDPYNDAGSLAEWEAVLAADASYRNRVVQFVRGVNMGATPSGIQQVASAVVGSPVRLYEVYRFIDNEQSYEGGAGGGLLYGDLEEFTYGDLEGRTYGSLEGSTPYTGKGTRTEFVIRPMKALTHEERYHLTKVVNRLKPVGSLMSIDAAGLENTVRVEARAAYSDSTHWTIRSQVLASADLASAYARPSDGSPVEQPRAAFSEYQGEEWFYNGDVLSVTALAVDGDTVLRASDNFERTVDQRNPGRTIDHRPEHAVTSQVDVMRGRAVRDGVLVTPMMARESA